MLPAHPSPRGNGKRGFVSTSGLAGVSKAVPYGKLGWAGTPALTFNSLAPHLLLLMDPHPSTKNGGGAQRPPRDMRRLFVSALQTAAIIVNR